MTAPILEAINLSKSFSLKQVSSGARKPQVLKAVDALSLELLKGETVGIAGESGCGKSTLAKMLSGLLNQDSGEVRFIGRELSKIPEEERKRFRKSVQMIFQDPFSSLNPRMRVGDAIAEPLVIHKLCHKDELAEQVAVLMEQTGLSRELYNRFPHEFSGGQRQRIVIARALAASPSILVADEPVSALDISIQAQIINLLLELRRNHSLTMIMISHDMSVLRQMCDRIAVMYLGRIIESAPATSIFTRCRHPYTEALLEASPSIRKKNIMGNMPLEGDTAAGTGYETAGCPFHPRCKYVKSICLSTKPSLLNIADNHLSACHFATELYGN